MTLIECFDACATENIAACLYLRPQKMVLFGDQAKMRSDLSLYREVLAQRGICCDLEYHYVDVNDVDAMVRAFIALLSQNEEFVIDIAGGDEQMFLAAGAALASLPAEKRAQVTLQQLDPLTGTPQILGNRAPIAGQPVQLKVHELVRLQGGIIYPDTTQPGPEYTAADLDALWALVRRDAGSWNRRITTLREFESKAGIASPMCLDLRQLRGMIRDFDNKLPLVRSILWDLYDCGAIQDYRRGDCLEYRYASPLMRACTMGPGNILENKVLLEARGLLSGGKPYFHDLRMGVHIDWDGVVHEPAQQIPDTHNEIDLILMRGAVPLFISCKNGDIKEDEIYKLNTVATRFGAPHARKMLIATDMGSANAGGQEALVQRGRDMDVIVIPRAATLTRKEWRQMLMAAMQGDDAAQSSQ